MRSSAGGRPFARAVRTPHRSRSPAPRVARSPAPRRSARAFPRPALGIRVLMGFLGRESTRRRCRTFSHRLPQAIARWSSGRQRWRSRVVQWTESPASRAGHSAYDEASSSGATLKESSKACEFLRLVRESRQHIGANIHGDVAICLPAANFGNEAGVADDGV